MPFQSGLEGGHTEFQYRNKGNDSVMGRGVLALDTPTPPAKVMDINQKGDELQFPECYNPDHLRVITDEDTSTWRNHQVMLAYHDAEVKRDRRGAVTAEKEQRLQQHREAGDKLRNHMEGAQALFEEIQIAAERNGMAEDGMVHITRVYNQHHEMRTRRYVNGSGAQRLSRSSLRRVLDHSIDFDISACVFTLLPQILDRLQVQKIIPEAAFPICRAIATDRAAVIRELGLTPAVGKETLNNALNGERAKVSPEHPKVTGLRAEGRALRWLAVGALPELYDRLSADAKRHWPEATVFHHFWTVAEDSCLEAWARFCLVRQPAPRHLSLHFDGLRIDTGSVADRQAFVEEAQAHILRETGFTVRITEKKVETFMDLVISTAITETEVSVPQNIELKCNCIPIALAHLRPQAAAAISDQVKKASTENVMMALRKGRRYRDWSEAHGLRLRAHLGLHLQDAGEVLIHYEDVDGPHCAAASRAGNQWNIINGRRKFLVNHNDLVEAACKAMSADDIVTFVISDPTDETEGAGQLLDLIAGSFADEIDREATIELEAFDVDNIDPGEDLLHLLRQEVSFWRGRLGSRHGGARPMKGPAGTAANRALPDAARLLTPSGKYGCPLCPKRAFQRQHRVVNHLQRYHDAKHRYTPSGTKQLRIIIALRDDDVLRGFAHRNGYLERSAKLMRKHLAAEMDEVHNKTDQHIQVGAKSGDGFPKRSISRRWDLLWGG